jgi:hypothetical protein
MKMNRQLFEPGCLERIVAHGHQSSDPQQNTATALHEFLIELEAYCSRDE